MIKPLSTLVRCLLCAVLGHVPAAAQVVLPHIFQDGMVLQRDVPIHVWGLSSPGETVTAEFHGERKTAVADELGRWQIYLAPAAAGGPYDLNITGSNSVRLKDVLIGDVWLAGGQSNMEWTTSQLANGGKPELANANIAEIRLIKIEKAASAYPLRDITTLHGWERCSSESAARISAIAYLFAREIHQHTNIPIGIIDDTWGGTSIESWTSLEATGRDASLMPVVAARGGRMRAQTERELRRIRHEEQKASGKEVPDLPWRPEPPMWSLGEIYNAMVAPITMFPIKGVIWYQGEANTRRDGAPELYGRQLQLMISDWREKWGVGTFPFYFVQLANFRSNETEDWPAVREGQRQALQLANTGMASTIDIGDPDDVHPLNKQDGASRLARIARAHIYGETVEYSGPILRQALREGPIVRLSFDHASEGLVARGSGLKAFELAGVDGRFHPAEAQIDRSSVLLHSPGVPEPAQVRFAWQNNPNCCIWNKEGLPASPFNSAVH